MHSITAKSVKITAALQSGEFPWLAIIPPGTPGAKNKTMLAAIDYA